MEPKETPRFLVLVDSWVKERSLAASESKSDESSVSCSSDPGGDACDPPRSAAALAVIARQLMTTRSSGSTVAPAVVRGPRGAGARRALSNPRAASRSHTAGPGLGVSSILGGRGGIATTTASILAAQAGPCPPKRNGRTPTVGTGALPHPAQRGGVRVMAVEPCPCVAGATATATSLGIATTTRALGSRRSSVAVVVAIPRLVAVAVAPATQGHGSTAMTRTPPRWAG